MSGRLEFVVREGDQIPRLDGEVWPKSARLSTYKTEILTNAGVLSRDGAGVHFNVANGSAIYRVIGEHDDELVLLFVEGRVIWPG